MISAHSPTCANNTTCTILFILVLITTEYARNSNDPPVAVNYGVMLDQTAIYQWGHLIKPEKVLNNLFGMAIEKRNFPVP